MDTSKCVTFMRKHTCVTDMVSHINDKIQDLFVGMPFEDPCLFYHNDVLSTMTDKDLL